MGKSRRHVEDETDIDETKKPNFDRHRKKIREKNTDSGTDDFEAGQNPSERF